MRLRSLRRFVVLLILLVPLTALAALPAEAEWALVVLGDGPNLDVRALERMTRAAAGADAQILVNGTAQAKRRFFLEPGSYQITLQRDGYKPLVKAITVEKGKTVEVADKMEKQ